MSPWWRHAFLRGNAVDEDGSRLHMGKAEAAERLQAQIERGKEIHWAITQAASLNDLQTLKSRLSRWSQHNQLVLEAIFGESERSAYRSAGLRRGALVLGRPGWSTSRPPA